MIVILALTALAVVAMAAAVVAHLVRAGQAGANAAARSVQAGKDIGELVDHLEKLAGQIDERIDRRLAQVAEQLSRADARIAEMNQQLRQEQEAARPIIKLSQATGSEISRLGKEGLDAVEIARRMRMNVGEVELILNLQQSSRAKQARM